MANQDDIDPTDETITAAEIEQAVAYDALQGVQSFAEGDKSVTAMDLQQRLEAAKTLRRQDADDAAAVNPRYGLRISKMISPGAWD